MSIGTSAVIAPRLFLAPGTLIEGKYSVQRIVGQGNMGCVFLALNQRLDEDVALKFMHPLDASEGPEAFASFLQAARAAARFRSDHVVHIKDMGMLDDGSPYLVMEHLEGQVLEAQLRNNGPLPVTRAVDYALQACQGLAAAHAAGIVHRDLRPSNWFLSLEPDGTQRVKLLDFGMSKITPRRGESEDPRPAPGRTIGTPPYSAPEQLEFPADVERTADIWSVGAVLYEMLAGVPPFADDTPLQIRERALTDSPAPLRRARNDVPAALEAAVMLCLEKEPDRRFRDTTALARALAPFQTSGRSISGTLSRPPLSGLDTWGEQAPPLPRLDTLPAVDTWASQPPAAPASTSAAGAWTAETHAPESAPLAIVSPVVASTGGARAPSSEVAQKPALRGLQRLRQLPRMPLIVGAGAIAIAAAVFTAGAGDSPEAPGAARTGRDTESAPIPERVTLPARPIAPTPPIVAATPAPPAVTELPQPSLPEPSAAARTPVRPQAVAKSASTGGAAPVGTAGFGERE
jgi:serine/threonine-protein kinase